VWLWLVVLAVLIGCFWVSVFVLTPGQKRLFDEYGLKLPWLTKRVIDLADMVRAFWFLSVPLSAVIWGGLAAGHGSNTVPPRVTRVITILVSVAFLAALAAFAVGFGIPQIKLAEGLAK
jgi:type II secretory pathway component PulF